MKLRPCCPLMASSSSTSRVVKRLNNKQNLNLKHVVLVPTWTTADAKMMAEQFIRHVIYVHGIATEITSDQDVRFRYTDSFWQNFFRYIGTSLCMSSARHQNTNGQAERTIAQVEELLRMGINYEQSNWSQL